MKPGTMLQKLREVELVLLNLLYEGPDEWESLDVDYEPPRVQRLWRQVNDVRVYLHRIHPCAQALYHPHPWPSAVRIIEGYYEMGVAESDKILLPNLIEEDREVARFTLTAGSAYEMINPNGWHFVKPHSKPSLSIMVTAKPWDPPVFSHDDFGKKADLSPLPYTDKRTLIDTFAFHMGHKAWSRP